MGGGVAAAAFELLHDLAGAVALEPLVGNGGAGDGAAQAFELLALHRRDNVPPHVLLRR